MPFHATIHNAARDTADAIDSHFPTREPAREGKPLSPEARDLLEQAILEFAAYTISSAIDAGSEKEVILEDEEFKSAIHRVCSEW